MLKISKINKGKNKVINITKELSEKINEDTSTQISSISNFSQKIGIYSIYLYNVNEKMNIKNYFEYFINKINKISDAKLNSYLYYINKNTYRVDFKSENVCNDFYNYIKYEKLGNPELKYLIIKKLKNTNLLNSINNYNYNKPNTNISNSNSYRKLIAGKKMLYNLISIRSKSDINNEDPKEKKLKEYFRNQNYIRNSSPYITTEETRILEEIENKKKFISNKNFITSVGKYSAKYYDISNYVQSTPSENPLTHQFRIVDKKKWISPKDFLKC